MESDKKLSKDPSDIAGNDDTFYQEAQHIKEEIIDVEDNEESSSFLNTSSEYSDLQDEKNGDANSVLTRAMDNWDRQKKLGILMEIKCEECHLTWEKPVNLDHSYNGLGYIDCPECDGEMMYQCSRCKQHFQKYDKICKHLEQKCYVNYDVPESSRTIQRFDYQVTLASILEVKCKECDLTLESPDNLDYKFDQEYKKCEVSYIDCPECDGEMKYQCPNCKMQFRKYDKAYRHLKRICYVDIVFEASKTKQVKSNIVRNCSYCEYSTTNLTDLRRHYSIAHQKTKSTLSSCHICWRCNNRYKTRETMLKHARFCGLAPHIACNFCSYRTKRSEHLRIHIQHKHPGPEFRNGDAYHCPKCKKKYKYLMSMKSHARRCRKTGEEEDEDN